MQVVNRAVMPEIHLNGAAFQPAHVTCWPLILTWTASFQKTKIRSTLKIYCLLNVVHINSLSLFFFFFLAFSPLYLYETVVSFGFQHLITIIISLFKSKATTRQWVSADNKLARFILGECDNAFGCNYRHRWHWAVLGFTAATGQRMNLGECCLDARMMSHHGYILVKVSYNEAQKDLSSFEKSLGLL